MKTPMLLEVDRTQSKRAIRKAKTERMKAAYGIQTHNFRRGTLRRLDWLALSMPMATRLLAGQRLTNEEKTDLAVLMAGYCRILDEGGLLADGFSTEYEAVKRAVEIAIKHGEKAK